MENNEVKLGIKILPTYQSTTPEGLICDCHQALNKELILISKLLQKIQEEEELTIPLRPVSPGHQAMCGCHGGHDTEPNKNLQANVFL